MLAFALAVCGGRGGYRDAPRIALPAGPGMAAEGPVYQPPAEQAPAYRAQAELERPREAYRHAAPLTADLLPPTSPDVPPDAPQGAGPRGTSGEVREDVVGYAALMDGAPDARFGKVAVGVAHPSLPPGGFVEITSLDTGRTIVAMVVAQSGGGSVVALSPGAAQALGVGERAAVRVRTVDVGAQDQVALRSGQAASPRLDAPPALITALRRTLPAQTGRERRAIPARTTPARSTAPVLRAAAPAPAPIRAPIRARGTVGFYVQVAALSSAERAAALAQQLGGHVAAGGGLYRVQIGPFADMASAGRARDGATRCGYGGARIFHSE